MVHKVNLIPVALTIATIVLISFVISSVRDDHASVEGQVVSFDQTSLTTFSSLRIEDDSGKQWIFIGSNAFTGFTPSHLEEHRTLREPITVEYEKSATGELTILSLSD